MATEMATLGMVRNYHAEATALGITARPDYSAKARGTYFYFRPYSEYGAHGVFLWKKMLHGTGWSSNTINRLAGACAKSLDEVRNASDEELLNIRGMGLGGLIEIRTRLGWAHDPRAPNGS